MGAGQAPRASSLVTDSPGVTRVDAVFDYALKMGPVGSLMDAALVKRQFTKAFDGLLAGLDLRAERARGEHLDVDVTARARLVAQAVPAVVSPCETAEQQADAVARLLAIRTNVMTDAPTIDLRGAEHAADEIFALINAG